jgi:hypothetical protein
MNLLFHAKEVTYSEALGGDIVQVSFQEEPDPDIDYGKKGAPLPPVIKYVLISANYEFSGIKHVEWCDGEEFDGGQSIRKVEITKTRLKLVVVNGFNFEVTFNTDEITFQKIVAFLSDVMGESFV